MAVERRVPAPLVRLGILRARSLSVTCLVIFALAAVATATLLPRTGPPAPAAADTAAAAPAAGDR